MTIFAHASSGRDQSLHAGKRYTTISTIQSTRSMWKYLVPLAVRSYGFSGEVKASCSPRSGHVVSRDYCGYFAYNTQLLVDNLPM